MMNQSYSVTSKYYDEAYELKKNMNDLPFYLELALRQGGPVLEIGCGTGRILLEIARKGVEIHGVDISTPQLEMLKTKLTKEQKDVRNRINLTQADMRYFNLDRKFNLIIIPFRPLQHLHTIEDQINALNSVKHHLDSNGRFAFDVFYPKYKILFDAIGEEISDLEWKRNGLTVKRYYKKLKVDLLNQNFEGEFIYRSFRGDALIKEERESLRMSYYTYPHLQLLFRVCGLEIVDQYGSFKKDPIDICKEMIFILRKK